MFTRQPLNYLFMIGGMFFGVTSLLYSLETIDQIKINEVYYDATGTDDDNEFIELYNAGNTVAYLDGAIISDEGTDGTEGIYKFPGNQGETDIPIAPNEWILIAIDAIDDGIEPELSDADWELHGSSDDFDNPQVPNLENVNGTIDMILANSGDGILLADGADLTTPIDPATVVDGMNYENVADPVPVGPNIPEGSVHPGTSEGQSVQRIPDGADSDDSAHDFIAGDFTPGISNSEMLTVTSPNGGENWLVGKSYNITWISTGSIDSVKLEYAIDGGTNWLPIIESTPNDSSYSWTIPDNPSTNCLVKISDAVDGDPWDVSDSSFTISIAGWDISGRIGYYFNNDAVDSALVNTNSYYSDTTDLNGNYELLDLPTDNYVVRPEKEHDVGNVISALDAAWILQHGVELRTFIPYQLIAGDVTGNGSVTAYDAARVLQFDVGLISKFPVMPDTTHFWRFVPADFPVTPSNWTTAPDSIAYTPLNSDTTDNYVGIIYGDVTGNWHQSGSALSSLGKSSGETVDIRLEEIARERGDRVILPVVLENGSDILAMSFTLEYDARVLKALSTSTTEITENWQIAHNIKQGQIRVAVAGIKPIATSGAMVNLEFEVLRTELDEVSSPLTISEIIINEGNLAVNIHTAEFTMGSPVPTEYGLSQNYPNPFNAQTVIKYQLPKSGRVVLKIYNTLGQEVRTVVDEEKKAGYYRVNWDGRDNEGSGVSSGIYMYRIQAGDFVKVRKMLFVR